MLPAHECELCVYLVNANVFVCTFWCFISVSNLKAIGQLVMEILHFKDLGDTSVVTNAVVLVLGECQITTPTYPWGIVTLL